jgi:lipid A 3-O-deacylase
VLFSGVRISFTQVLRTPEFYQRDRYDLFGSINVTFRY